MSMPHCPSLAGAVESADVGMLMATFLPVLHSGRCGFLGRRQADGVLVQSPSRDLRESHSR